MLLCSVRDENPFRPKAAPPSVHSGRNGQYLCPVDGQSGGTWFGINDRKEAAVLLNGAFINHLPAIRSYGKSRGLIVRELLEQTGISEGWDQLDLKEVEPFTLVTFSNSRPKEFVWDGKRKHDHTPEENRPLIWSSATLYSPEIKRLRERRFAEWLDVYPVCSPVDLLELLHGFRDPVNGFLMQRCDTLRSLSICILDLGQKEATLTYRDMLSSQITTHLLAV